jgi:hypothetical protein
MSNFDETQGIACEECGEPCIIAFPDPETGVYSGLCDECMTRVIEKIVDGTGNNLTDTTGGLQ